MLTTICTKCYGRWSNKSALDGWCEICGHIPRISDILELSLKTVGSASLIGLVANTYLKKEGDMLPKAIKVRLDHDHQMFESREVCQLIELISHDIAWLAQNNCTIEFV